MSRAPQIAHADSRGRVPLAKFGVEPDTYYEVEQLEGDETVLILRRQHLVSDLERRILSIPENRESLMRAALQTSPKQRREFTGSLDLPDLPEK